MCGIIGYIGDKNPLPILLDGLKRLEYRGYDSAGVALLSNNTLSVFKKAGKVSELRMSIPEMQQDVTAGIAHTRWATHGVPNDVNAHPHLDCKNEIAVIHNGIIENYHAIRTKLEGEGHRFLSMTDTEVLAHLIEEMIKYSGDLETAVRLALRQVEGTYGIAVLSSLEPDKILSARKGSPLLIGVGKNEHYVASDAAAIVHYTRNVAYHEDA